MIPEDKIIEKCSIADEFCKLFSFHLKTYRCLKRFYIDYVCVHLTYLFPNKVSYNRFIELQKSVILPLVMFVKEVLLGKCTGITFVDSTPLKVCKNQRIHCTKIFKGIATRGHSSMGWFFGFKLHLVCNERGELLSFYLIQGNVDDRNPKHVKSLCNNLFGRMFGDKGYLSQRLWQMLFDDGIQLITKLKKKMKGYIMSLFDEILLRKRAIIGTINDELKKLCQI